MVGKRRWLVFFTPLCLAALLGFAIFAQQMSPGGPISRQPAGRFAAGATWAPCAAAARTPSRATPSQPDTFYFGSVGGGVWKTENSGRTWFPISDEGIPIGSIGAIAVAPSNPNIVYVGTGEPDIRSQHSYGIGMFKSTDAGKTWTHIGLEATRQIGRVVVDPANSESRLRRRARPRLRRQSRSAASIAPPTAAPPGRRSSSRPAIPTTSAPSTWPSIPRIRACSTLRCGPRAVRHGRSTRPPTCPAAGCTNPPMAATPGSN